MHKLLICFVGRIEMLCVGESGAGVLSRSGYDGMHLKSLILGEERTMKVKTTKNYFVSKSVNIVVRTQIIKKNAKI